MKKYYISVYDKNGELCYCYNKFESIDDLYIFIGSLMNESRSEIKVSHLEYYSDRFDTLESYILRNENKIIAKIYFNYTDYIFKLESK